MERVAKSIEGVDALHNINLTLHQGEILGVLGLHGSGKSTVVELLAGDLAADQGKISVNEEPVAIRSKSDALALGIHCVRTNTILVPSFTIAENIFVIRENRSGKAIIDFREISRQTRALLKAVGMERTPDTVAGTLSSLETHLVEIAKAINEGVRILVMDDVSDDYSPKEFEILKNLLRSLCHRGIGVLFASRRLEVALELSDRITVLRDGTTIRTLHRDEFSKQKLVKLLIGRTFDETFSKTTATIGSEVLKVENFSTDGMFSDIHFVLHRGEVLSLVDLEGNISNELVQALLGERKTNQGSVWLCQKKVSLKNYRDAVKRGIGLIPENWASMLFTNLSLSDNLSFLIFQKMSGGLFTLNSRLPKFVMQNFFQTFFSRDQPFDPCNIKDLSQTERLKILMYRWLLRKPHVLIMVKPSLRIDLVARHHLYNNMEILSKEGIAILLIATDLSEAAAISDRTIVVQNGKLEGEYSYREIQELTLEDVS
jgi:ribose transport system ATP-binding protein